MQLSSINVSPVSRAGRNRFVYSDSARPFVDELMVGSWNVEGLSEIKLWELTAAMRMYRISILCIQETRVKKSPY